MSCFDVFNDVVSQVLDSLIEIQNYLIDNYDLFKGCVVTVRFFGGDIVFNVDSIYEDSLKKNT